MIRAIRGFQLYRGWWIVLTGYLTQLAATGASGWVFGVLILPMQDDTGWSRSTIVGVLTLHRLLGGAVGVWLGPVIDRHGAQVAITISAAVAGTSLIALAAIQAPWQSYVLWAVFGCTIPGLVTVGPIAAISNWFIAKRAQAIMFFTFGSATAGLVLAPAMAAVADQVSWRAAWVLMGIMLWAIVPLGWVAIRHRPEDLGLHADGDVPAPPTKSKRAGESSEGEQPEDYWTVNLALRSKSFWLLTLGFMLTTIPASSIFIHMSAFAQSRGHSAEAGAAAVSVYGLGALLGRFVWGYGVAKAGLHRALVAWGFMYGISILLYTLPTSLTAIYGTSILLGVAIAGNQQLRAQTFPEYFGRKIVGSLLGYSSVIATIASAGAPLAAAIAFDQTGSYVATFVLFGLCCLLAALGFLFSAPKRASRRTAASLSPS